jgi:hypothetical protein
MADDAGATRFQAGLLLFFQDANTVSQPGKFARCVAAGYAGADDNNVVHVEP